MIAGSIAPKGSWLCELQLWREVDGTIRMAVTDMDPRLIETTGEEVPDRLKIIADWAVEGAANMAEVFDA